MESTEYQIEPRRPLAAEYELRNAIAEAYRSLAQQGLNHGSTGNISSREGGRILITPSGIEADSVTAGSIVVTNALGEIEGAGTPSCEWRMHVEIYRVKPEAKAIVHTHSDACVALSCLRRSIPAFHYMVASFGGNDIPCASYAPFGSLELARSASTALTSRTACLLANHGMICYGSTLETAVSTSIRLETLARQYLMALQAGTPELLTDEQIATVQGQLEQYSSGKLRRFGGV